MGEIAVHAESTADITPYGKLISPVVDIIDVPTEATVGEDLLLTGIVAPDTATNKKIVWFVKDAGNTGAIIEGNVLKTIAPGTVTITAQVINGVADGAYQKDFDIVVSAPPVVSNNLLHNIVPASAIPNGAFAYWMGSDSISDEWKAKLVDGVVSTATTPYDNVAGNGEDWEKILYLAGHDTASYEADFTWTFEKASFEQINIHTNLGDPWNGYANGNGQTDNVKIQAQIDGTWTTIYEETGLKNDSNTPRKFVFTSETPITATGLKVWLFAGNRDGVLPVAVSEIEALKAADGSPADGKMTLPDVIAQTPVFTTDLSATKNAGVGDTITMSVEASVNDGGSVTYQWYKNNVAIEGATGASYSINDAQVIDGGNYKVVATNTIGDAVASVDSTVCYLLVKDPDNLAQGCSYTVTEGLNFSGNANDDGRKLTDGQLPGSTAYGDAGYMTAHNPGGSTVDIIVDLGAVKSFREVSIDTLKGDGGAGVYPIRTATVWYSENGDTWEQLGTINNDESTQDEATVRTVSVTADGKAQYIKITVEQAANWFSLAEIRVLASTVDIGGAEIEGWGDGGSVSGEVTLG